MERSTKTKFVFVLIVGMVLSIVLLNNLFGGKQDHLEFEETNDSNYTEMIVGDSGDEENRTANEGDNLVEANDNTIIEEPNFEDEYVNKYGSFSVIKAKEVSKNAVTMWLEQETNMAKWERLSTSSFLDTVQKEIITVSDGILRKVKEIELRAFSSHESDDKETIRFGVVATWNILNGETIVGNQTGLFYVTLAFSNGKWLVTKIIEPEHENH